MISVAVQIIKKFIEILLLSCNKCLARYNLERTKSENTGTGIPEGSPINEILSLKDKTILKIVDGALPPTVKGNGSLIPSEVTNSLSKDLRLFGTKFSL